MKRQPLDQKVRRDYEAYMDRLRARKKGVDKAVREARRQRKNDRDEEK
jgi:hypothetical protein